MSAYMKWFLMDDLNPLEVRWETPGGAMGNPWGFNGKLQGFLGVLPTRAHNARVRIRVMRAIVRARVCVYACTHARGPFKFK